VFVAVIDSVSGEVSFAPFAFEDGVLALDGDRGSVDCSHSSDSQLDSELFIVQGRPLKGSVEGKAGTYFYRWHDKTFTLVHVEPACA